jgi:hypothetical protein
LDLRALSERVLRTQASEISRIIDDMRGFYGSDVVGRILQGSGQATAVHNYRDVAGAIPIPPLSRLSWASALARMMDL